MRLDQLLVTQKLTQTKSQANQLIKQGLVFVNGLQVNKPAKNVTDQDSIEIKDEVYVSRGAYKLREALTKFHISTEGKICADIGASTGGFTQILLQQNAAKIYCIDVGTDQLNPLVKNDPRVVTLEQTHILDYPKFPEKIDLVVIDLSFISVRKVLPHLFELVGKNVDFVILLKPQFEVGRELNKKGVVKTKDAEHCHNEFKQYLLETYSITTQSILSPIKGQEGNTEYLVYIKA
jgi:23S rRNA (cytidine1920-2'-O)/16S rRNA (cytidine1409-2'-O)-methyltransferase